MITLEEIERQSSVYEEAVGKEGGIYDISTAFQVGAITILVEFAKGLSDIIEQESRESDKYIFSAAEHEAFVLALMSVKSRILTVLQRLNIDIGCFDNHQ